MSHKKTNCTRECDKCDLHTADDTDLKRSANALRREAQDVGKKIAEVEKTLREAKTRCWGLTGKYNANKKNFTALYNWKHSPVHADRELPTEGEVKNALKALEDSLVDKLFAELEVKDSEAESAALRETNENANAAVTRVDGLLD